MAKNADHLLTISLPEPPLILPHSRWGSASPKMWPGSAYHFMLSLSSIYQPPWGLDQDRTM